MLEVARGSTTVSILKDYKGSQDRAIHLRFRLNDVVRMYMQEKRKKVMTKGSQATNEDISFFSFSPFF